MLEALGISTRDEQVYLALVEACEASIPDLGTRCGLGRAQVQAALAELEVRGLVSASAGRPRRYLPAAPELALESLIRGREDALTRLRLEVAGLARVARQAQPGRGQGCPGGGAWPGGGPATLGAGAGQRPSAGQELRQGALPQLRPGQPGRAR